jgi:hypothetical protein
MNKQVDEELAEYYRQSESWALDRERQQRSSSLPIRPAR